MYDLKPLIHYTCKQMEQAGLFHTGMQLSLHKPGLKGLMSINYKNGSEKHKNVMSHRSIV